MANEQEVPAAATDPIAETPAPAAQETQEDKELREKAEQKANLDKAILEAQGKLREIREETKKAKQPVAPAAEEIPVIDDNDPSAKAWTKRINDTTAPIAANIEKQKEEVRTFALRKFLADKPALAKSPEKLKEFMANYDRIKVNTEQTQEGVLMDFEKAYGATFYEELSQAARSARIDAAKEDMLFSDAGISRGATGEAAEKPTARQYTAEEKKIIEQWEASGAPKI